MKTTTAEKLVTMIDKAVAPPDPFDHVRQTISQGYEQVGLERWAIRSTSATDEIFGLIGAASPVPPATVTEHKKLAKQNDRVWGGHVAFVGKRTADLYQDYQAELTAKILAGTDPGDFYNETEFAHERQARITSEKAALYSITLQAHALLVPVFDAAIAAGRKLLATELEGEIERCKKFGIEMREPSPVIRAILATIAFYETRKKVPTSYCPVRDLCLRTVQL